MCLNIKNTGCPSCDSFQLCCIHLVLDGNPRGVDDALSLSKFSLVSNLLLGHINSSKEVLIHTTRIRSNGAVDLRLTNFLKSQSTVFQTLVCDFEKQSLLRIHTSGIY
jgi:hypothetical protein